MWKKICFSVVIFFLSLISYLPREALAKWGLLSLIRPVYAVKFGINVAQHDGITDAAKLVGNGGWVVAMMSPDNVASAIKDANAYNVNLVIRAHHTVPGAPELHSAYGREWVKAFADNYASIKTIVYFVPINEPNNPFEGINCSNPVVKEYLDTLLQGFQSGSFHTVVKLVTPSFDPFQTADNGNACYDALGGANYFKQFDAVSYHAYGQMRIAGMDTGASQLKQGNVTAFLSQLGLTGTPVIIDETGVVCIDCTKPDAGGGSMVKYPYTQQYVDMFSTYLHSSNVQSQWTQSNVLMFSMLSYSPETPSPDVGSWIDTSLAAKVVTMAEAAVGGGTGPNPNGSPAPVQHVIPTPTGLPGPVEEHLRNRKNMAPQSKMKELEDVPKGDCFFLDFHCQNLKKTVEEAADKMVKTQRQIAQEPAPPSNFFESVGSFFNNLFNVSSTPKGYGNTYFVEYNAKGNETGLGGSSASQDETVKTHQQIFDSLRPYRASNPFTNTTNVDYGPNPTGINPNPSGPIPYISIALSPPPATNDAAVFADYVFNTAHTVCTNSSFSNPKMTIPLNAANIASCLQGRLPNPVYSIMYQSAQSHTWLQCVGFVQAVEAGSGGSLTGRNAKDYCNGNIPTGYVYIASTAVQSGDIAVITNPPWGHIAVVKQSYPNGTLTVYEANWGTQGAIGNSRIALLSDWGCFLRRNH